MAAGTSRTVNNEQPCVARGTANADNPASAPASEVGAEIISIERRQRVYDDHRIGGCSTHPPPTAKHRVSKSKIGQNGLGGFCVFGSCVRIRSHRTGIRSLGLYIQWRRNLQFLL